MLQYYYIVDNGPTEPTYTRAHYHFCYELVYYIHGGGYSEYNPDSPPALKKLLVYDTSLNKNKKRFDVQPNDYIIYAPYTIHNEVLTAPSEVFAITFQTPEDLPLQTAHCKDTDGYLKRLIEKIRAENRNKQYKFNYNINAYLTEAIVHLQRQSSNTQPDPPSSLHQVIYYIDDYYMTKLDIDKLAFMAGYSPDHFRRLFKNETGLSPKQYILEKRLQLAKRQIEFTSLPLLEIALNCGYEDYMQFSAYFKKMTSQSPSDYRAAHHK